MRKKVMALVLTSAMAVSLAACGGGGQTTETAAAPAGDATTAAPAADGGQQEAAAPSGDGLVYWSMWEATEPQGQAIQAAVDQFTGERGIRVDVQLLGG